MELILIQLAWRWVNSYSHRDASQMAANRPGRDRRDGHRDRDTPQRRCQQAALRSARIVNGYRRKIWAFLQHDARGGAGNVDADPPPVAVHLPAGSPAPRLACFWCDKEEGHFHDCALFMAERVVSAHGRNVRRFWFG